MVTKGPVKKLTVYMNDSDTLRGKSIYEVLMEICYRCEIAGVSVFRGVAGYGRDGVFHTSKRLELSKSLPVKVEVVDSEELIEKILPDVTEILDKGLIEVSDTHVLRGCRKALERQYRDKD